MQLKTHQPIRKEKVIRNPTIGVSSDVPDGFGGFLNWSRGIFPCSPLKNVSDLSTQDFSGVLFGLKDVCIFLCTKILAPLSIIERTL